MHKFPSSLSKWQEEKKGEKGFVQTLNWIGK